jgi:hypothetical protein
LIPWMFCRTWFKLDDGFQSQSSAHDLCVFAEVLVMFDAQHWPFRSHMQGLTRYFQQISEIMLIYLPQLDSWHHVSDHAYFHSQDAVPAFILWSQVC